MNSFASGDTIRITKSVSYMNFFISNEVVLSAKYWKEGVKKLLEQLFPERKIIRINPLAINGGGSGIHRETQTQAKRR